MSPAHPHRVSRAALDAEVADLPIDTSRRPPVVWNHRTPLRRGVRRAEHGDVRGGCRRRGCGPVQGSRQAVRARGRWIGVVGRGCTPRHTAPGRLLVHVQESPASIAAGRQYPQTGRCSGGRQKSRRTRTGQPRTDSGTVTDSKNRDGDLAAAWFRRVPPACAGFADGYWYLGTTGPVEDRTAVRRIAVRRHLAFGLRRREFGDVGSEGEQ
jgi:hypothetical protein